MPKYKPGDYLECGEGGTYSRILVLSENLVVIKDGDAVGIVMTLDEWYHMIGDRKASIEHTSYFDTCNIYDYYIDDDLNPSLEMRDTTRRKSMSTGSRHSSSSLSVSSMLIIQDVDSGQSVESGRGVESGDNVESAYDVDSGNDIVQVEPVIVPSAIIVPSRKKSWSDWFIRTFLCGLVQTEETREKPT